MSDSVRPNRQQPTRLPRPWDSLGKNTEVGFHFLLQWMRVKSQSEVTQSCPTLSDPMTAAHQAPPSMGFSRQEYWSGIPLPSPSMTLVACKHHKEIKAIIKKMFLIIFSLLTQNYCPYLFSLLHNENIFASVLISLGLKA